MVKGSKLSLYQGQQLSLEVESQETLLPAVGMERRTPGPALLPEDARLINKLFGFYRCQTEIFFLLFEERLGPTWAAFGMGTGAVMVALARAPC